MTSGSTSDTYARNAEFWVKIIREDLDRYRSELTNAAVLRVLGDCEKQKVVDVGCGEGYMSRLLAERGAIVTGIDSSSSLIAAAKACPSDEAEVSESPTFYVANAESIPEADGSFDMAVLNHVLSDIEDPRAALSEVGRVLRPGGIMVALMLHPCFYTAHSEWDATGTIAPLAYFGERSVEQTFVVAGTESPSTVRMTFRPLEYYAAAIFGAGMVISDLQEPHPSTRTLSDDPWWRANFSKPLFLLLGARVL